MPSLQVFTTPILALGPGGATASDHWSTLRTGGPDNACKKESREKEVDTLLGRLRADPRQKAFRKGKLQT
jgi:hypothetical protein